MRLLLVLALLTVATPAAADTPVEVTAKVVEMPKRIIYCGVIAYRAVVRYEVISVDKGTYTGKEVLAVELCPELLKVGATRKLRLVKAAKQDGHVDEFTTRKGTRWVVEHR